MTADMGRRASGLAIAAAAFALPLLGALAAEGSLARFLHFPPPLEIPTGYPRFSWLACTLVLTLLGTIAISWAIAARRQWPPERESGEQRLQAPGRSTTRRFPRWGWWAVAWMLLWWVFAWTRFPWFAWAQRYTFFPLWLGFILTVNALTEQRRGMCLMRRAPGRWAGLFAASAAFWWLFEWLNRFVRNWHYLEVENFGATAYAAHATLSFSTVLPAVAAVREWLGTFARLKARFARGPAWGWLAQRATAWLLVAGALGALVLTGVRPQEFYPAVWIAPLALAWGIGVLANIPGTPQQISQGNWGVAAAWMLAALICGFWWELWNVLSLAKWIYTVPYVERWHVFEMPLLGYAGYLPFGLECLLVMELLWREDVVTARAD